MKDCVYEYKLLLLHWLLQTNEFFCVYLIMQTHAIFGSNLDTEWVVGRDDMLKMCFFKFFEKNCFLISKFSRV